MRIVYCFLLAIFLSMANVHAQSGAQALEKANELYQSEQFRQALNAYKNIEEEGYFSKTLFYNLGNTYYRLGDKGRAVLYYERALVLAPNDKQVKQDLAFVKSQLSDEIIPLDVFPLISFWESLKNGLSSNAWTFFGLLFFWLGIAGLVLWQLGASRKNKKIGFFGGIASIIICLIPFLLAIGNKSDSLQPNKAVILKETTALKSSPAAGSETLYTLFEGATVTTIDQVKEWKKVGLANGYQGWVNEADIELVEF